MLTLRGWSFLLSVVALLALAVVLPPAGHVPLALVGLTLALWFLAEWLLFAVRWRSAVRRLEVKRQVCDEHGDVVNLWAGRTFTVRVAVYLRSVPGLSYALLIDRVPFTAEKVDGDARWEGRITAEEPAKLTYRIHCPATGQVRFVGLALHLADLQGFFYHRTFVPDVAVYRVLPVLGDVDSQGATTKRFNLLPPPGVHRHRRPGSGSELLDLRDYRPGDPPRMIAWKVSARRDRLITKEFESDVPIRCTLFVDTSHSVRLGPPGQNALGRLAEIAAAVAQASAGNRDPIGLGLFDDQHATFVRPARTRRHLSMVLNLLADAAGLTPATGEVSVDELLPLGYSFAQEVYPDLMRSDVNSFPSWLPWLAPRSVFTNPRPTVGDCLYALLPYVAVAFSLFVVYLLVRLWFALAQWLANSPTERYLAFSTLALAAFAMVLIFFRLLMFFFPAKRRAYRWRKQLAAVLSVRYGLAPGGLALLLEDDRQFSRYTQQFLAEHHVPVPLPLYSAEGRYLFASPGKVDVLAQALLRAVGKGHDNELFVLLADLLELTDHLGPLLRAVKVTLARHHQVMVVCPWPPGIALPDRGPKSTVAAPATRTPHPSAPMEHVVRQATTQRFHEAFYTLRRTFARLGVPVVCALGEDPARLIVDRLDRLRTVRSGPGLHGKRT